MSTTKTRKDGDPSAGTDDLVPTQVQVLESRIESLERDLANLRASHDADADGDLMAAERLIPKSAFDPGETARQAFVAAQRLLRERLVRYEEARRRLDRLDEEIRAGGGAFRDGSFLHPQHERLREERADADADQQQRWREVEEAEADLEEARAQLRQFVAVTTRGARISEEVAR